MAKARESGMPDEVYWETFFDVDCVNRLVRFVT